MGIFDLFRGTKTDDGVKEFRERPDAVLLDVRTPPEYQSGHIEGSLNLPLDRLEGVMARFPDLETPLYVYCRSGARSAKAAALLRQMGYHQVKNIGGIADYHGKVVY